jgi:hypothetical protein
MTGPVGPVPRHVDFKDLAMVRFLEERFFGVGEVQQEAV